MGAVVYSDDIRDVLVSDLWMGGSLWEAQVVCAEVKNFLPSHDEHRLKVKAMLVLGFGKFCRCHKIASWTWPKPITWQSAILSRTLKTLPLQAEFLGPALHNGLVWGQREQLALRDS